MSERKRTALLLASGGAYAAYEVGVMKALFAGHSTATGFRAFEPDVICALGMGAVNAGILAANDGAGLERAVALLEEVWLDHFAEGNRGCGNGLYRIRGLPAEYLNPRCYLANPAGVLRNGADDALRAASGAAKLAAAPERLLRPLAYFRLSAFLDPTPLHRSVRRFVPTDGLRNSRQQLRISALNAATGKIHVFNKEAIARFNGAPILAAAASAIFFPLEKIDGTPYIDASLLIDTPLKSAIKEADEIHVVYMDPDLQRISRESLQNSIDVFDRFRAVQIAYAFNQDIRTVRAINHGLEVIEKAWNGASLTDEDVHAFLRIGGRAYRRLAEGNPYHKLTIHRFHPRKDLGNSIGLLNLDRDHLRSMIDEGYRDAVAYNPTKASSPSSWTSAPQNWPAPPRL